MPDRRPAPDRADNPVGSTSWQVSQILLRHNADLRMPCNLVAAIRSAGPGSDPQAKLAKLEGVKCNCGIDGLEAAGVL